MAATRAGWAGLVLLALGTAGAGCDDEAEPAPEWDGSFASPVARPEHPRPDLRRDSFLSLNTVWQFAYDPDDEGIGAKWYRSGKASTWPEEIQVPYAWESPLSGLVPPREGEYEFGDALASPTYRGVAWYRLELPGHLPPLAEGNHWYVVFGAVDYQTTVYVNGKEVGRHEGGYDPFSIDLSAQVGETERPVIVLRVEDDCDLDDDDLTQPVGKQGGVWYTRTSGIWQSVYLEARPAVHVESYRVLFDSGDDQIRVRVRLSQSAAAGSVTATTWLESAPDVVIGSAEQSFSGEQVEIAVPLAEVDRWEPDAPVLYGLDLAVTADDGAADVVHGFYGLVEVATEWHPGQGPADGAAVEEQYQYVLINGRPRYLRCVLDQSYWPDGIMTAPSLQAIRADLEAARDLGFNCIRLHIKADEPVKYRLMDEMGFLVIYDMVALDLRAANYGPEFAGRARFETAMRRVMERDANHPSIAAWVVFNENWGLSEYGGLAIPPVADSPEIVAWATEMVNLARELDPTRPSEDNSAGGLVGAYEHFDTDLNTFHWYGEDISELRSHLEAEAAATYPGSSHNFVGGGAQDGAPWLISELGPFSVLGNPTEARYCKLWSLINEVRRQPKLVGMVITELTDVEYERNGLLDYHRARKTILCERDGVTIDEALGADFIGFEDLPGREIAAGSQVTIPLWYAHWSGPDGEARRVVLRWADGTDQAETSVEPMPYHNVPIPDLVLAAPAETGSAALIAEVFDQSDQRIAANRVEVLITE